MYSPLSLVRILPNLVTLLALLIGFSAIRLALENSWENAIWCVFAAGMLDIADGKLARILKATSPFGIELDSFADLVNFGVTPAVMVYLWHAKVSLSHSSDMLLWGAICFYVVCSVLRLAKFNIAAQIPAPGVEPRKFFLGVPSPMGAMFALIPIVIGFEIAPLFDFSLNNVFFLAPYLLCIGLLMASRLPTPAIKFLKIPREYSWLFLLGLVVIVMALMLYPWYVMPSCALFYLCSLIVSFFRLKGGS